MDHSITISGGVPDWAKRLKSNDSPHQIHRSTDCIAKELNKHGVDLSEVALKNAPSWSALDPTPSTSRQHAQNTQQTHQHQPQQQPHHLLDLLHHQHKQQNNSGHKSSADSPGASSSSTAITAAAAVGASHSGGRVSQKSSIDAGKPSPEAEDEEAKKAAELAAKKSRIKQSLVKRARSVAIFSLKLKERRQRDAEKAAQAAIEHAKVSNIYLAGCLSDLDMK